MRPDDPRLGSLLVRGLPEEPLAIALGVSSRGTLLVADSGDVRRIVSADAHGTRELVLPRTPTTSVRFVVDAASAFLLVSAGSRGPADSVLVAERIDPNGPTITGARELTVGAPLATLRRAVFGSELLLAYAGSEGPVHVARVDASTGEPTLMALPDRDRPDGLSREVLAAHLDGAGAAVLFRRGAPEDDRGGVELLTERTQIAIEPLHDLALLETFGRSRDEFVVVGAFEFDRPHAFRFAPDGSPLESRRLAPGERVAFVEDRARADVDAEPGSVELRIRDAAGDVTRSVRIPRTAGTTPPSLARDVHDFVVATTDRTGDGWAVRLVRIPIEDVSR